MLIRIKTTNDANGNPRRGWLRVDAGGSARSWIEEGYEGEGAISAYKGEAESLPIIVTPKEFKRLRRLANGIELLHRANSHLER